MQMYKQLQEYCNENQIKYEYDLKTNLAITRQPAANINTNSAD